MQPNRGQDTSPEVYTMPGLISRIAQRLLALAASLWHNWQTSNPDDNLTAYDH